ncbi:MAG TPA: competence protein ComEC, partial [Ottowia sp.]|nr:competence protein ComEC [Ottowia sp.]
MTHTGPSLAARPPAGRGGHALAGLLLGALLGVALQLQQARLWSMGVYAALVLLAPLLAWAAWRSRVRGALVLWLLAGALAAGSSTGWRAGVRQAE